MAFLFILILLVVSSAVYLHFYPLSSSSLLLLGFIFSMVFFLSRFDGLTTVWIGRYPLSGLHLYLLALLITLSLVRGMSARAWAPITVRPLSFLALYALFSVLSGGVNAGFDGVLAAFQGILITLTPALLAWVMIETMGQRSSDTETLRRLFILPLGLITPLILMVSALLPGLFSGLLGWGVSADFGGFEGFTRGWSPMGSTILTGCLVVMAYVLALHEAVARSSKLHVVIAALAAASILFTASRAVMVMFILVNGIYWILVGRWRVFARVAALPVVAVTLVVGWSFVTGEVNFSRFLVVNDNSTSIRTSSALGAVEMARKNILLGQGPGQVYSEMRTVWVANKKYSARIMEKAVGGHLSAMEPHNLYLYLLAEHGLLAMLAFVAAMLSGVVAVWRTPTRGDLAQRSERALYIAVLISFAVVFATASWPLINAQFSMFFWLFVFMGLHGTAARRAEAAV